MALIVIRIKKKKKGVMETRQEDLVYHGIGLEALDPLAELLQCLSYFTVAVNHLVDFIAHCCGCSVKKQQNVTNRIRHGGRWER